MYFWDTIYVRFNVSQTFREQILKDGFLLVTDLVVGRKDFIKLEVACNTIMKILRKNVAVN
jgi:hypothetical protein